MHARLGAVHSSTAGGERGIISSHVYFSLDSQGRGEHLCSPSSFCVEAVICTKSCPRNHGAIRKL